MNSIEGWTKWHEKKGDKKSMRRQRELRWKQLHVKYNNKLRVRVGLRDKKKRKREMFTFLTKSAFFRHLILDFRQKHQTYSSVTLSSGDFITDATQAERHITSFNLCVWKKNTELTSCLADISLSALGFFSFFQLK